MRKPAIRSVARPADAEVRGSMQTRMVLQSCSSSRRNSSADQGCLKAARSISITSSRSSDRIRRISKRGRARTAMSARLRRTGIGRLLRAGSLRDREAVHFASGDGTPVAFERIEDADIRLAAQIGEQPFEQPLVFLPPKLLAHAAAVGAWRRANRLV